MNAPVENAATLALEQGFQLGELRIDPKAGEAAGPGGSEKLDPKVIDVLVMLAQNPRQVVLREDLLARLWPNVVVTDEVLSRCIYELRKQLSLAGGSERYKDMIETVPKRGYRLNADIAPIQAQAEVRPANRSKPRLFAAAIGIVVAVVLAIVVSQRMTKSPAASPPPATKADSIAVLPFVDMSEGKDQGYLADGISEEILNHLAQAENLRVIARTSSFALRDSSLDVAEIAKRLNVTHVLEGSVRKSGEHIRITAQLISASNSSHVWSDTYDRGLGDLFAVQDEIANAVAKALAISLSKGTAVKRTPASIEAYEKFLQGEFFYYRRARGDFERSSRYYEEAVAIDPRFARAWAALAGAYSILARETDPAQEALQSKQGQAARKAVELEPNLAEAQFRLAQYYDETGNREKADEHYRRAVALDPDVPFNLSDTATNAVDRGDLATAITVQRRLVAQNPLATGERNNLAVYLLADGQLDEALSQFREVREIHPETDPHVAIDIVHVLILQRRFEEAQSELATVPEGSLRDQAQALLYAATGRQAEADEALRRLTGPPGEIMDTIRLAEVYAFRGMNGQAFQVLQDRKEALKRAHGRDLSHVWYLQHESRMSPFLKTLHSDPRWAAFMTDPS